MIHVKLVMASAEVTVDECSHGTEALISTATGWLHAGHSWVWITRWITPSANDATVNEVKVCSHGKVKSLITTLSDANTTENGGSAPSISVSQSMLRGKAGTIPEAGPSAPWAPSSLLWSESFLLCVLIPKRHESDPRVREQADDK